MCSGSHIYIIVKVFRKPLRQLRHGNRDGFYEEQLAQRRHDHQQVHRRQNAHRIFGAGFLRQLRPDPAAAAGNPDNLQPSAVVQSTVVLGKAGTLSKTSAINLTKLILTAVSSATPADTVRDTSTVSGNAQVTVTRSLTLKPLRTWTVSAVSKDAKDSVIHTGSSIGFFVNPADTAAVTLNLTSRFAMYQADFNTLPDSISSSLPGTGKDKLNLNRVVLKVDGVIKADSLLASGYFSGSQSVNVYFDYVTPGSHTVTLGKVGKVTINGGLPGAVIP